MKYSIFNFFYDKKYGLVIFILNFSDILGLHDLCSRIMFIVFTHIALDILIFIYQYVYTRSDAISSSIKEKLDFSKKEEPVFDIMYNKEKFCTDKKTVILDRPRCRYSTKNRRDINNFYTINSTVITKSLYL
jgi:hypothetical protein